MFVIQEISGYFLFGIIGMIGLSLLYLPIYFLLRKRIPLSRQLVFFLLIVCIIVISSATFLGWTVSCLLDGRELFVAKHTLNLVPFRFISENWEMETRKQITQTIANVIMFMPIGFIFPVAFKQVRSFGKTTICMLSFSLIIEFIQYFIGRSADVDDLMLNVLGGMLGYMIFHIFSTLFKGKKIWLKINGDAS